MFFQKFKVTQIKEDKILTQLQIKGAPGPAKI